MDGGLLTKDPLAPKIYGRPPQTAGIALSEESSCYRKRRRNINTSGGIGFSTSVGGSINLSTEFSPRRQLVSAGSGNDTEPQQAIKPMTPQT